MGCGKTAIDHYEPGHGRALYEVDPFRAQSGRHSGFRATLVQPVSFPTADFVRTLVTTPLAVS